MLACTLSYYSVHPVDKQLLYVHKETMVTKADFINFAENQVYPTHTSLTNEIKTIGRIGFRYMVFKMPSGFEMTMICDHD
jgi:hypothetical protein